jgi:hypothetical protein
MGNGRVPLGDFLSPATFTLGYVLDYGNLTMAMLLFRRMRNLLSEIKSRKTIDRWRSFLRLIAITFFTLALPIISPIILLLELFLVALLIAALLPFKVIQDAVQRLNAAISAVIGDCLIFATSALRRQSVTNKFLRDIAWLASSFDCKHIVVVAHSQGAAIAYLALKRYRVPPVRLLVTFGAGIVKLDQLMDHKQQDGINWSAVFFSSSAHL